MKMVQYAVKMQCVLIPTVVPNVSVPRDFLEIVMVLTDKNASIMAFLRK